MDKLNKYLINNFFNLFITLFGILFIISSMILLLTISNVTVMLKINMTEFLYLYFLSLPQIIFFTLPITFFITSTLAISKLFENSELISVLSLGINPKKILKPFLILSIFITILSLIITFLSIPSSTILYRNFINIKKDESNFNFKASSTGEKFGNWNIFIDKKIKNINKNIVMFNNKDNYFITANKAKTYKKGNYFVLELFNGNLYKKDNKIYMLKFDKLDINQKLNIKKLSLESIKDYISKYPKKLNKYFIISFFPLIAYFFIAGISFFHNRYQKNHSIIYTIIVSIAYYVTAFVTYKNLYAIFYVIPIFIIIGIIFTKKRIRRF